MKFLNKWIELGREIFDVFANMWILTIILLLTKL